MSVRVFISATSQDLGSARQVARDALLKINTHPIEQTDFAPDYRTVRKMIEERIESCQAVIHVVGRRYGAEPDVEKLPLGEPRRSYTQLEYDTARRLGKKLYVFVCPDDFLYDDAELPAEDEALASLQDLHRKAIIADDQLYTPVADSQDLATLLRELQVELEGIKESVGRQTRRLTALLAAVVIGLAAISFGVFRFLPEQSRKEDVATREVLQEILARDADQSREGAIELLAAENGITPDELQDAIMAWTVANLSDSDASPEDRALAVDQLLDWEVGGEAFFTKAMTRPNSWGSGVMIGINYDLARHTAAEIEEDWSHLLSPRRGSSRGSRSPMKRPGRSSSMSLTRRLRR
jgi:hypothetical protein